MAAFQRETVVGSGFVEDETDWNASRVARVAAHHAQQRPPGFFAIRVDGYGMLIDIGQSFHIEEMY